MTAQAQPYICDLTPYQPGSPIEKIVREYGLDPASVIKLASNENPLGMSPKAKRALKLAIDEAYQYPEQHNLAQALAGQYAIDPASIVIGNGSNDVLDLIARTFLGEGAEAISAQYAFAIYAIATQSVGAANVVVPAKAYGHDLGAMLQAVTPKTRVIWIANPNNPTGTFIPYTTIKQFLANVPKNVLIVLDEAYYEYLPPKNQADTISWLKQYSNLILVRTFSKVYGLAGLRTGYGLAHPDVIDLLQRVRQPFNVNRLALAAATAALQDHTFVRQSRLSNSNGRKQLIEGLHKLGLEIIAGEGNFVTCMVPPNSKVSERLLAHGIIVRPLGGYGLPHHIRITIGTAAQNQRFLNALRQIIDG